MHSKFIEEISSSRAAFAEVAIAALILGLAVSLLASIIYDHLRSNLILLLLGSLIVIFLCLLVLAKKIGKARTAHLNLKAFFILDTEKNTLVKIPRYRFGESLCDFMRGAFKENRALQKQWDIEKIYDLKRDRSSGKKPAAFRLVEEATEYFILERLSTHLTDYFNAKDYSKKELKEYTRNDVPDILLNNRFMELFSAPMKDRAIFQTNGDIKGEDRIVYAVNEEGGIYAKFDLILPRQTRISRTEDGILIDAEYFTLSIKNSFDGMGFVIPRGFLKYYLGKKWEHHNEYKIKVDLEVNFKLKSLFGKAKWDYHSWLDGFLTSLAKSMEASTFFKEIQWELASTMLHCGEISKKDSPLKQTHSS